MIIDKNNIHELLENVKLQNGELQHHGIKGQRWGVIRSPNELRRARGTKEWETYGTEGAKRARTKRDYSKEGAPPIKKATQKKEKIKKVAKEKAPKQQVEKKPTPPKKTKPKDPRQLTTAELQSAVRRLELEKQYYKLTATPKKFSTAKQWVSEVLYSSSKKAADKHLTKMFDDMLTELTDSKKKKK